MMYRNGWFKITKASPWEHFSVVDGHYFRNGAEVGPFDFDTIWRNAYRSDSVAADDNYQPFQSADFT